MISCDDWNARPMDRVLALELVAGINGDVPANLAPVIQLNGQQWTVYGDFVVPLPKDGLTLAGARLLPEAMDDVDDVLRKVLALPGSPRGRYPGRPSGHPYAGHVRYADLKIEKEGDKPVVVVSSEYFGGQVEFGQVLVCRLASNSTKIYEYEVPLSSKGKVVCSDLRTVLWSDLRDRTTEEAAVNSTDREAILRTVCRLLELG